MIRLVTQFDGPSARPAAATPSCCCCSCCSCCIVTVVAASIYTAVSAQRVLHGAQRDDPERVRLGSPFPGLIGFLALPLALFVAFNAGDSGGGGLLFLPLAVWVGLVGLTYWLAGHRRPWLRAAVVVVLCVLALAVEFAIWYSAIDVE